MVRIKGHDLMVFKKELETYKSIAHAVNHTMDLSGNELDVSDKDSADFAEVEIGQLSWSITSENVVVIEDTEELIDAFLAKTPLELVWNIKETAPTMPEGGWVPATGGYEGKAVITSISVNAPNGDKATCNVTFKGTGPLTKRK